MKTKLIRDFNSTGFYRGWLYILLVATRPGPLGAGYLGGATFYVGWRPNIGRGCHIGPLFFGVTRNANRVPLCTH